MVKIENYFSSIKDYLSYPENPQIINNVKNDTAVITHI